MCNVIFKQIYKGRCIRHIDRLYGRTGWKRDKKHEVKK